MASMKLTVAAMDRLKPPSRGRLEVYDQDTTGLVFRVTPMGAKSFSYFYRLDGRNQRLTIGRYPSVTLKDARTAAREARAKLDKGIDPALEKMRMRQDAAQARKDSFRAVAMDYIERGPKRQGKRTWRRMQRILEKYPEAWHNRPMRSITKRDVADLLDHVHDNHGPTMANYLYATLSTLFYWALGRGVIETMPINKTQRPSAAKTRNRPLKGDEIRAVWEGAESVGHPFGDIVKLALLTGQRRTEVSEMHWDELDLDAREWLIPADRTKAKRAHVVPLSDLAIKVLESVLRHTGPYVFSTSAGELPFSGFSKAKRKLDAVAKVDDFQLKDLRETVATIMRSELSVSEEVIAMVLNHAPRSVTIKHYAAEHDMKAKRIALEKWERYLRQTLGHEVGNIAELSRA